MPPQRRKETRCRNYYNDGTPVGKGCRSSSLDCYFAHPEDREWTYARLYHRSDTQARDRHLYYESLKNKVDDRSRHAERDTDRINDRDRDRHVPPISDRSRHVERDTDRDRDKGKDRHVPPSSDRYRHVERDTDRDRDRDRHVPPSSSRRPQERSRTPPRSRPSTPKPHYVRRRPAKKPNLAYTNDPLLSSQIVIKHDPDPVPPFKIPDNAFRVKVEREATPPITSGIPSNEVVMHSPPRPSATIPTPATIPTTVTISTPTTTIPTTIPIPIPKPKPELVYDPSKSLWENLAPPMPVYPQFSLTLSQSLPRPPYTREQRKERFLEGIDALAEAVEAHLAHTQLTSSISTVSHLLSLSHSPKGKQKLTEHLSTLSPKRDAAQRRFDRAIANVMRKEDEGKVFWPADKMGIEDRVWEAYQEALGSVQEAGEAGRRFKSDYAIGEAKVVLGKREREEEERKTKKEPSREAMLDVLHRAVVIEKELESLRRDARAYKAELKEEMEIDIADRLGELVLLKEKRKRERAERVEGLRKEMGEVEERVRVLMGEMGGVVNRVESVDRGVGEVRARAEESEAEVPVLKKEFEGLVVEAESQQVALRALSDSVSAFASSCVKREELDWERGVEGMVSSPAIGREVEKEIERVVGEFVDEMRAVARERNGSLYTEVWERLGPSLGVISAVSDLMDARKREGV